MFLKYLVLTGARGFSGGSNLLISLFIATSVSTAVMGEFARVFNLTAFLAPYLTLGLAPYFTRELAKRRTVDQTLIFSQAQLHLFFVLVLSLVAVGLSVFVRVDQLPRQISQLLMALAIAAVYSGSLIISGVMRGVGRPLYGDLPIYLLIPIIYAAGIFWFSPSSSLQLFLCYSLAHIVSFGALMLFFKQLCCWTFMNPRKMQFDTALLISTASTSLLSAGQIALAAMLFGAEQLANLHLGFVVANSVNLAFASVIAIHQRKISDAHSSGDKAVLQREVDALNKSLFAIGLFVFVVLIVAIPIVADYLPKGYGQFRTVAFVFLLGQLFNFAGGPSIMFYLMIGKEKDLNKVLISISLIGLILASISANFSMVAFVSTLCLMTFAWNATLVVIARRRYGIKLYITSFLSK